MILYYSAYGSYNVRFISWFTRASNVLHVYSSVGQSAPEILLQVLAGVADAHDQGVVHRDMKPENIFLSNDGGGKAHARVLDFGVAKAISGDLAAKSKELTVANMMLGTPLYMSPEIVRRRPTDKRVDIFSFGVTCYCLVSFHHPWQGEILNGRAALHHDTSPPTDLMERCPNVDPRLSRAIMNALNPKVDERTPDMDQFLHAIRSVESAFVD